MAQVPDHLNAVTPRSVQQGQKTAPVIVSRSCFDHMPAQPVPRAGNAQMGELLVIVGSPAGVPGRRLQVQALAIAATLAGAFVACHDEGFEQPRMRQRRHHTLFKGLTNRGKTQNVKVRGALGCNDGEVALNWALEGFGILLRAEWDIARYVRSGRLRLVLEDQTPTRADVYAVYPQQLHLSARVRSLIDFLVERFTHIDHLDEAEPW